MNSCIIHLHPDSIVNASLHLFLPHSLIYGMLIYLGLSIPILTSVFPNHLKLSWRQGVLLLLNTSACISQNPGHSPHDHHTALQIRKSALIQHHHPVPRLSSNFPDCPDNDASPAGPGCHQGAGSVFGCHFSSVSPNWVSSSDFPAFMSSMILKYRLYIL